MMDVLLVISLKLQEILLLHTVLNLKQLGKPLLHLDGELKQMVYNQ
jgi:hypothetical protein